MDDDIWLFSVFLVLLLSLVIVGVGYIFVSENVSFIEGSSSKTSFIVDEVNEESLRLEVISSFEEEKVIVKYDSKQKKIVTRPGNTIVVKADSIRVYDSGIKIYSYKRDN